MSNRDNESLNSVYNELKIISSAYNSDKFVSIVSSIDVKNNDKVGLILFSDKIEKFIPPQKGRSHVFRLIRELLFYEPDSTRTSRKSLSIQSFQILMCPLDTGILSHP